MKTREAERKMSFIMGALKWTSTIERCYKTMTEEGEKVERKQSRLCCLSFSQRLVTPHLIMFPLYMPFHIISNFLPTSAYHCHSTLWCRIRGPR